MVIAKKNDYWKIFIIATFFSTLGGVLGYFIGSYFLDFGMSVVGFYGYEDKVINLKKGDSIADVAIIRRSEEEEEIHDSEEKSSSEEE